MFFELRQYRLRPGTREAWVCLMEEVIIPFQVAKGMVVVGSFIVPDDPEAYVWIRRFESEDERARQYDAVYESEEWKTKVRPRIDEMLIREQMVVTRIEPTPKSVIH